MNSRSILVYGIVFASIFSLAGCGTTPGNTTQDTQTPKEPIHIVTSFAPLYSHVKKIVGDTIQVTNLVPVGISIHEWQPTPKDLIALENSDLIITNGLGLEEAIQDKLEELKVGGKNILEVGKNDEVRSYDEEGESEEDFGCKEKGGEWSEEFHECTGIDQITCENIQGSFNECASACRHNPEAQICTMQCVLVCQLPIEEHDHHGVDPHVWLNPQNVINHVNLIVQELIKLDPIHSETYRNNADAYIKELKDTDTFIRTSFEKGEKNPFIVFHDAYYYFLHAYGLESYQIASIKEFEGDTPTLAELSDLLSLIKTHKVKTIFTEPQFSPKIVDTISTETAIRTIPIDPIGGALSAEGYLDNLLFIAQSFASAMNNSQQ